MKKTFQNLLKFLLISDIAERYVGIPYKFGGDLEKSKALDLRFESKSLTPIQN